MRVKQFFLAACLLGLGSSVLTGCGGCGGSGLAGGESLDGDSLKLTSEAVEALQPLLEDPSLVVPEALDPIAAKFRAAYQKDDRNGRAKAGYAVAQASLLALRGIQGLPPETKVQQQAYPAKTLLRHMRALSLGWIDGKVWRGTSEDGAPFRAMTVLPLLETSNPGITGQALTDHLAAIKQGLDELDAFLEAQGSIVTDAAPLIFTLDGVERKFGAVELKGLRSCLKSALAELNLVLAYNFAGASGMGDSIFKIMKVDPSRDGSIHAKAAQYLPPAPYATLTPEGRSKLELFAAQIEASTAFVREGLELQEARPNHTGWMARPPEEGGSTYAALLGEADLLKKVVTSPVRLTVEPSAFGGRYEGALNVPSFVKGGAPGDLRTVFPQWNKAYFGGISSEPAPGEGSINWAGSDFGGLLSPKAGGRFYDSSPVLLRDGINWGINVFMDCVGRGWDEVPYKITWVIEPL